MYYLRQSTASQEVLLGPFLDTDGAAATGLTIGNTDIKVWKHGGTSEVNKNSGGATHIAAGRYYAVLDATDTDTVGSFELNIHVAGALPVKVRAHVLEEAIYDALFAASATGLLPANVTQFGGSNGIFSSGRPEVNTTHLAGTSQTARDIGASVLLSSGTGTGQIVIASGVVRAFDASGSAIATAAQATLLLQMLTALCPEIESSMDVGATGNDTTHIHLSGLGTYGDDEINDRLLVIYDDSTTEYHTRWVLDYVASTKLATVALLPFTPVVTEDKVWLTTLRQDVTGGSGLDAAGVRDAVGLAAANLDTQLAAIDTDTGNILVDTNELQTDWADGGRLDLIVDAILVDTGTTLQGELDGIQADTEDIQTRLPAALTGGGNMKSDALAISGDTTAADTLELFAEALDQATGQLDAGTLAADTITAASINTGAFTADAFAANAIVAATLAADCITAAKVAADVHQELIELAFTYDATATYAGADAGSLVKQIADNAGGSSLTESGIATAVITAMFLEDSGTNYASAVAGSVVKETADNAGGSSLTEAGIADAVLDELLSGHTTSGSLGERVGRIPNAAAGGNGGLPTVDANNRIAGIVGTITTLDALDTAQDSQHATTQTAVNDAASAIPGDVWDELRASHTGASTFGAGVASVIGNVGGNVTGSVGSLATQAKADVNAEVDAAIETYHLDHLLAATYDPASKPGAADALLNELVESDAGVSRFTANALEEGPAGGGGGGIEMGDAIPDPGTAGTVGEALRQVLDNLDAPISGVGGAVGSGADAVTLTITEDDEVTPIADADVWIKDSANTNIVAGTLQTDGAGQVTFLLDDGVQYRLYVQKDGFNAHQGTLFTAEAD